MYYRTGFKIFAERDLSEFLRKRVDDMHSEVENEAENYILNVNEIEYIKHITNRYSIDTIDLKYREVSVSSSEKELPAEYFPPYFDVRRGQRYKTDVIKYHIPYTGNSELLKFKPSSCLLWTRDVIDEDNCVCFEIINFQNDVEQIKREANHIIDSIRSQLANVLSEINTHNLSLESQVRSRFESRKHRLLKKNSLVASLGVPIKKRSDLPSTFAIKAPQIPKKIRIDKPMVTEMGFKPDPTLNEEIFKDILQIVFDVGKQFERLPSTYSEKSEESLRDHFLLFLEPNFEGSATGETFNKAGKTDILLRYENTNVFIAECKFWKGEKSYLDTITQLLAYLTWRDSKVAVIMFVRNKEFSSVLQTVETVTSTHPNYLGFSNRVDESWLNYRFHINGDRNREVKLAVLLFHIPQTKG